MKPIFIPSILVALAGWAAAATITGEPKMWHKLTLDFSGPDSAEAATPNPFTDYRLDVTFLHPGTGKSYVVPGYFAADGNAANSSATSGNVWRAHFAADEAGSWTYTASFRAGTDVATDPSVTGGTSAGFFDGETGSIEISPTDKGGRDFRGKGRLQYVGKHHLRFAGTGDYFMKAGADSPENLLSYADFDGDFKTDGQKDTLVKTWAAHVADWQEGDPVWQGGKGKGLIGAINYLASEGLNAFSFLTMNINGDDRNVFPYTTYGERSRLDVSRLDQWEIVFEHGTRKGMYLHFKTQETENELLLDGGNLGPQRKLYYRELIARFGHHLALNWNLGEETNDASTAQKVAWSQYFYDTDPYHHHQVIHNGDRHYELMGNASHLTGFSRQMNAVDFTDTFADIKNYVDRSVVAGKLWVVAADEPGDSQYSVRPDNDPGSSHTNARKHALWATIMAGGAGCEFYFGYALPHGDLTCTDLRSRDAFWDYCRYALQFFEDAQVPFELMKNQNSLVSGSGNNANRCLAATGQAYLVHLPSGGSHTLNLSGASGSFAVTWFNPRTGDTTHRSNLSGGGTVSLGSPPDSTSSDWVVFVRLPSGSGSNSAPVVDAGGDRIALISGSSVSVTLGGAATDDRLPAGSVLTRDWSRVSGPAGVTFSNTGDAAATATFTAGGSYVLRLTASDGDLSSSDELTVTIIPKVEESFSPTHDASTTNGTNSNTTGLRVENGANARIAYLQFDLGTIGPDPFAVTLRLTEDNDISSGVMTLRVHAANSNNWTESGINGSNAPSKGAELASFTGNISDGLAVDFNVGSQVTGPGIYSFIVSADPSTLNTTFCSSEHASVALRPRLVVTTIEGTFNHAPVVSAGPDGSLLLSGESVEVLLSGTASDDGLPEGSVVAVAWSMTGGPAPVTFVDPANASTTATFTATGSYTLRLTASDGERTAYDEVIITVNSPPANQAPSVNAGPDGSVVLSSDSIETLLSGTASDDGLPQGSVVAVAWSMNDGPAPVTFADPANASTTATFTATGSYTLRLTASDGELADHDEVMITVNPPPANQAPSANAGPDKAGTLSAGTVAIPLTGSATDDGLPAGSALAFAWTDVSGPATASFSSTVTAATTATFNTSGIYVLRLTVSDSELASFDEVTITISPPSPGPTSFGATHDAYLQNGTNFNNSDLRVESSSRIRVTYLQFDLSLMTSTPATARLRLTEGSDTSGGTMTLRSFIALSNNWTESSINGGNAPAKGGELDSFTGDITNGKVVEFDVSSLVTGPGIYSFILQADASSRDVAFASSENSTVAARPALVVTFPQALSMAASRSVAEPSLAVVAPSDGITGRNLRLQFIPGRNQVHLVFEGLPEIQYVIERSTDLHHWEVIHKVTSPASGVIDYVDPSPSAGRGFYRLSAQP